MSLAGSIIATGKSGLSVLFIIVKYAFLFIVTGIMIYYIFTQFKKLKEEKEMNKFCIDNNITRDDLDIILDEKDDNYNTK